MTFADDYEKYGHLWVHASPGNHEEGVLEHTEYDLTKALVGALNDRCGTNIQAGGYVHWNVFRFHRGTAEFRRVLWGTHGYGGGGPVTEDMIQAQRQRAYVWGFDIGVSAHTHNKWDRSGVAISVDKNFREIRRPYKQLKLGCYADHYGYRKRGFVHKHGMPPKPKGAYWVRFFVRHKDEISFEVTDAA
jgi:hypothetical protein